jgi:hypothetical protein
MPTPYGAKFVKCPFYRNHDANRIVCEGLAEGNTVNLVYESQAERKQYMKEVCDDILGCRDCPIYLMLNQKYEEDEKNG